MDSILRATQGAPAATAQTSLTSSRISSAKLDAAVHDLCQKIHLQHPGAITSLRRLLVTTIDCKATPPLDQRRRELMQECRRMQDEFQRVCSESQLAVATDADEVPVAFTEINERAIGLVEEVRRNEIRALILLYHPDLSEAKLNQLDAGRVQELHTASAAAERVRVTLEQKLASLIQTACLPADLQGQYKVTIVRTRDLEAPFQIQVAGYTLLGYSIFDLLRSIQIIPEHVVYNGEVEFDLTAADFTKLNEHLSELFKWADEIRELINGLVGEENLCVELGQKPLSEILRSPIRISPDARGLMGVSDPNEPCLLFNTLSLNLDKIPDLKNKVFLRAKFQEIFDHEKLKGANGLDKKFLHDAPFRTNLGINQVMLVCPHLNRLIKLQQLVVEYTTAKNYHEGLQVLASDDHGCAEIDVLKQFQIGVLCDTHNFLLGVNRDTKRADYIITMIDSCATMPQIEGACVVVNHKLLSEHTGLVIKRKPPAHEFTSDQINSLYGPEPTERFVLYKGGQRHRNVVKLFTSLRECPAYKKAIRGTPGLAEGVAKLEQDFVERLNRYHLLSPDDRFFGRKMVDEAVRFLQQYVAKIVYQAESQVCDAAIEKSMLKMAAIAGADLSNGCERGFSGRVQELLLTLVSSTAGALDSNLDQFRLELLDIAFQTLLGGYHESSMAVEYKVQAARFLNISEPYDTVAFDKLHDWAKALVKLVLQQYSSVAVYNRARTYVSDRFWELNRELDDAGMYAFLADLGITGSPAELDKKYRINGNPENRWQYSFFQQELPRYLAAYLLRTGHFFIKESEGPEIFLRRQGARDLAVDSIRVPIPGRQQAAQQPRVEAPPVRQEPPERGLGFAPASRVASSSTFTS